MLILVIGPLVSWISSWALYGFGQIVENTDILLECLQASHKPKKDGDSSEERLATLMALFDDGIISEEEYQKAIEKMIDTL